jgi:phosphate starvation-inducible PhoH-like protein|uniref:PhoH-like protein n=1 Tax=viral metagenome TaxID=1070528 RepID=A0A6C0BF67_9ZZZZ
MKTNSTMISLLSKPTQRYRVTVRAQAKHQNIHNDLNLKALEKNPNHKAYAYHIANPNVPVVIGIGPAGCGKTLISCAHAINRLVNKEINKVVITRPAVSMDESHGYLPGDIESKMMPWLIPIYDCFKQYVSVQRLREYIQNEDIEICPMSFIRGRTFNNSWIIADEVQNSTVNQMKTLLTRIGNDSKMILTGDLQQCDLKETNGLEDFLKRHEYYRNDTEINSDNKDEMIKIVKFEEHDIMRSEIVKYVLDIYKY